MTEVRRQQGAEVALGAEWLIAPRDSLPDYDTPSAQAFRAWHRDKPEKIFLAYICRDMLPPRRVALNALQKIRSAHFLFPQGWGVVNWPADNMRRFAIIVDMPPGARLLADINQPLERRYHEEEIIQRLIRPACDLLKKLYAVEVPCGGIRISNLFQSENATDPFCFGDFVTAPSGLHQPVLFESPGRSLADPVARGPATIQSDLYALGVTILFLYLGKNPLARLSDQEIIQRRTELGSYAALVGNSRISGQLVEPLRGMLVDQERARWSLRDLEMWLSGRRLTPKQASSPRKATRAFEWGDVKLNHARILAYALRQDPQAALRQIENQTVENWLKRAAGESDLAERVTQARISVSEGRQQDVMFSRALMAMDPEGPIQFRDLRVMPEGIGAVLARAYAEDRDQPLIEEMIQKQLPVFWYQAQRDFLPEFAARMRQFEILRTSLERGGHGEGLERVLYELCRSAPCYSSHLKREMVMEIGDVLPALEALSQRSDKPQWPMDRHIAAFIATRGHAVDQGAIRAFGETANPASQAGATIAVLANLQSRFGPETLPGLASWCLQLCKPRIESLRNHQIRQRLQERLKKAAQSGSLVAMREVIEDREILGLDDHGYMAACKTYAKAERFIAQLEAQIAHPSNLASGNGAAVAVMTSLLLALLIGLLVYGMGGVL